MLFLSLAQLLCVLHLSICHSIMASWITTQQTPDLDLESNKVWEGRRKVSTASVMECLKWKAGTYSVVVEDAAPVDDTCIYKVNCCNIA